MSGWWKFPVFRKTSKSSATGGRTDNAGTASGRVSSGRRGVVQGKVEPVLQGENEKPRAAASTRQIHPLCDDKAQLLAYETKPAPPAPAEPLGFPPPPPLPTYPLAPNICVEGGRIEFIKPPPESAPVPSVATHTVTRAQQTCDHDEKSDIAKESLEARVLELERALEAEQKSGQRDRLAVTRLQRQLARREVLQRDVDRERRLRLDTEVRLRDSTSETERCRARLAGLQREFARMEETVRSMLQYKARSEQLKQEKTSLTVAYETRLHQFQNTVIKLGHENEALKKQLRALEAAGATEVQAALLERLKALETDNCNLTRDAEIQRHQYERCLDDVANQVVRALLSQKGLREEITALQRRIKDLENQNRALTSALVQQLQGTDLMSVAPQQGAGEDRLTLEAVVRAPSMNLMLPGLYSPSGVILSPGTGAPDTPVTSVTSVSTPSTSDLVTPNEEQCTVFKGRLQRHQMLGSIWDDLGVAESTPSPSSAAFLSTLTGLDPLFWLPLQRPRSLNLQARESSTQMATLSMTTSPSKCQHRRTRPIIAQSGKKPSGGGEDEGSESPESGNRDEGYSTMSSDVQGEAVRSGEVLSSSAAEPLRRGLEDVKEASDETDTAVVPVGSPSTLVVECSGSSSSHSRLLVMEDACDPDVLYIPLGLTLGLTGGNPRHSFPPARDLLPYQHIMRSFSDSHLCLKFTTTASPPCSGVANRQQQHSSFSFSSTASSSPSVLVLDVLAGGAEPVQNPAHPLRRTKATASLLAPTLNEHQESADDDDTHSNTGSWCSGGDLVVEGCWWDADYVQHWLRLDETRSALQQQHRDLMELEYDQAELEDWSMSLSCEDITSSAASAAAPSVDTCTLLWKRPSTITEALTPGQPPCGMLPSIQENNALELEEDSNECLWNNASYLLDRPSGELMTLLLDGDGSDHNGANISGQKSSWPYGGNSVGVNGNYNLASPGGSWSSTGTNSEDCCHSYDCAYNGCTDGAYENSSKRYSAAMSGCSDDAASTESPAVGTDFTRDFYRLVKFESTKSLASTSSRSLVGGAGITDTGGSLTRKQGSELHPAVPVTMCQDREQALQSVLNFIAEQQQYCTSREQDDLVKDGFSSSRPTSVVQDERENCSRERTTFELSQIQHVDQENTRASNEELQLKESHPVGASGEMRERSTSTLQSESPTSKTPCSEMGRKGESGCVSVHPENTHLSEDIPKLTAQNLFDVHPSAVVAEETPCKDHEQIHTIIELDTRDHVYLPVDENEIHNPSNKKEKYTEVLLNEHNSSIKHSKNNKVMQELKESCHIELCETEEKRPVYQHNFPETEEGINLTMHVHSDEISCKTHLNGATNSKNKIRPLCNGVAAKVLEKETSVTDACPSPSSEPHKSDLKQQNECSHTVPERSASVYTAEEREESCLSLCPSLGSQLSEQSCVHDKGPLLQQRMGEVLITVIEEDEQPTSLESSICREMTESLTSTVSTPDTVVCPTVRKSQQIQQSPEPSSSTQVSPGSSSASVIVLDGPPHARAASFHERATSKDVIEELNRMIRKGEDGMPLASVSTGTGGSEADMATVGNSRLDLACCCPTGWVHVERDIDFTDPKARANLLDVMLASSGSSGNSSTSSSTTNSESGDEPVDYQHLHRLHRFRRQKKASATREPLGVLRYSAGNPRPSIIGRDDFFVRYGEKEREAVASFDFLEEMSTTSVSGASSCDTLGSHKIQPPTQTQVSPTPSSDDSDDKTGEQISISDSCAASYSSSSVSLEAQDESRLM